MGRVSIKDPDCGPCQAFTDQDGKTVVVNHLFPKGLQHHYELPALGATTIPVYRGKFDHDSTRYNGVITIDLQPKPTLVAHGVREVTLPGGGPEFLGHEPAKWADYDDITLPAKNVPKPARTSRPPRLPKSKLGAVRKTFAHLNAIEVGDPSDLDQVTFFVFNGWYSLDGLNTCHGGIDRQGRLDVKLGDWQLRIEPRGDVPQDVVRRHLRATGNSAVTHIGRVRRDDGKPFDASAALELLGNIESLMGFALGRVTAIALPVGYRAGRAAWTQWRCSRAIGRPIGATPFLDQLHTAARMAELFRAGHLASLDGLRWDVFKNCLGYHYATEHDATVNMKVLLPVSALQLISNAYLVEELPTADIHHLSNQQWRALDTVDQLRKVLTLAGIDLTTPTNFAHLTKVQTGITDKTLPYPDALDCVVRLRNRVAHPKQKDVGKWTIEDWAETGFAATTMFNLAMLWWLNYDERYLGKTSEYRGAGDSVYVPWHQP